jgi:saccharopine dehydrogenase-like NADP-dependent oxidoreductase
MKITVIGAGAMGSAVAYNLVQLGAVSQVQVCDAHTRSLQELHAGVDKSPKLRSYQVDARDLNALEPVVRGSDAVVACTPPQQNLALARLCLASGSHFCDLGGDDDVVEQQLDLAEAAREQSLWIIPNCGLAPGLVNILCLRGLEQFDEVEAAQLRVGDVPWAPEPPFNFRVTRSPYRIIDEYTNPVQAIHAGQIEQLDALTHLESIHFEPPFGAMEAFFTAGSLSTLTADLVGRVQTLEYKTIQWPGHANQMRFLLGLGLGDKRYIDVRTHLTYRDILARRLRRRLGGEHEDAVLLRVLLNGVQNGNKRTLVYEMIDRYNEGQHLTAMKRCTSIPAATVALLVASGEVPGGGAAPPEQVVPKDLFCDMLAERGLNITTTWHDGYLNVTDELPSRVAGD